MIKKVAVFMALLIFLTGCANVETEQLEIEEPITIRRAELTQREEALVKSMSNVKEAYLIEVVNIKDYNWINIYLDEVTDEGVRSFTTSGSQLNLDADSFLMAVSFSEQLDGEVDLAISKITETGYSKSNMKIPDFYRRSSTTSVITEKEYVASKKNIILKTKSTYGNELLTTSVDHLEDLESLSANKDEIIYVLSFELMKR